jgi:hypothetical protein
LSPPAAAPITVEGNVEGSIVVGDNNFVVNTNYGTIIMPHAAPRVQRRAVVPQPPRKPRGFIGRSHELGQIEGWIAGAEPVYLHGPAGLGKTSLAKQAANGAAARLQPDGVVFLQGVDQRGAALGFADLLQMTFEAAYDSEPQLKVDLPVARTYLSGLHPLVLLSGFALSDANLEALADLFPSAPILIEAEQPPAGDVFTLLRLGPLAREDSVGLLRELAGPKSEPAFAEHLEAIAGLLNDTPAALVTVGRAIGAGRLTIEQAVRKLQEITPKATMPAEAGEERAYRVVLPTLSAEERALLLQTGAAPGISVDRKWLEETCGGKSVSEAVETLGLVQANSPRLRTAPGLLAFLSAEDADAARGRLLKELLARLRRRWRNFDFVRDELGNLLGLLEWAAETERWAEALALARSLDPFLTLRGLWDAWGIALLTAHRAAQALADSAAEAWVLHQLGTREIGLGELAAARVHLQQAQRLRLDLGDETGAAYSQHNLDFSAPALNPPSQTPPTMAGGRLRWIAAAAIVLIVAALALGLARSMHLPPGTTRRPTPSQSLATATLQASATPSPSLTSSYTSSPTYTTTPTWTATKAVTATPTFVSLMRGVMKSHDYCFYGPGRMYLYFFGLLQGVQIEAIGRNDDATWIYVQFPGVRKGTLSQCWFSADSLALGADALHLQPIYPDIVGPPISQNPVGYPHLKNVNAVRNDDRVTVSWDPYLIPLGDRESENSPLYLLETWVCRDGKLVFAPHGTSNPWFTVTDEPGCAEPSHGRVFLSEKHGYIGPELIDWPSAQAPGANSSPTATPDVNVTPTP